jgi:hypothetical protein
VPDIDLHGLPFDYEESVPFIVGPDNSTPHAGKKICIRDKSMGRMFDRHLVGINVFVIESSKYEALVILNNLQFLFH